MHRLQLQLLARQLKYIEWFAQQKLSVLTDL